MYEGPVQALIEELGRLPGIGPKGAQRIAFHLLELAKEDVRRLSATIVEARERITWCTRCFSCPSPARRYAGAWFSGCSR